MEPNVSAAVLTEEPTPKLIGGTGAGTSQGTDARLKVFLAWTTDDIWERRENLAVMLEKAGMDVFPQEPRPGDETTFRNSVEKYLTEADLSLHMFGGEFGATLKDYPTVSWVRHQYERAVAKSKQTNGRFRRVVWNMPLDGLILQGEQQDFIINVQNNLSTEVMFTTVSNAAQFIEDLRSFVALGQETKAVPKEYDMAFISNVQDAADCYLVIEKLSEDHKLTTLTVVPENERDYRAEAADMIRRSRLAVVYFKESSDWAIAFVKQLWKHVGGASAQVPFLLIGEDEPRRNRFLKFRAPQVLLQVVRPDEVLDTLKATYARLQQTGSVTEARFAPYTGLRPFNEDESIFFKGRERHIDQINFLLDKQKFVMVTGASGDGKSSLVFAGVIPNLKGGFLRSQYSKWAVADFRPEREPLHNMALAVARELRIRNIDEVENSLSYGFSALIDLYKKSSLYCDISSEEWVNGSEEERRAMRRRAANLLILVDQFEEFFTNIENYRDGVASPLAQITINVLIETVRIAREEDLPIYVVCTMRSDYIGQCVAFRGFAELIGVSTYYVPRLKREEIQEVVQGPAYLNGDKVALRLTQRMLNDLGDGIDQLPVLQHSLHQMWTLADEGKREVDLIHYAEAGGLGSDKLPQEDRKSFEQWFAKQSPAKQDLYEKPRLRNVLNRHANELYETAHIYYNKKYKPAQPIEKELAQTIVRNAFTCLTKIDENRAVRNRMTLAQITDIGGIQGVDYALTGRILNIFREPGNTFLQPFITEDPDSLDMLPVTVLDITHESLIRNWERLVEWAETENRSVMTYTDFKVQLNRWLANDCSPKFLLGRGQYTYFQEWFDQQKPTPSWIRRYLRPDELVPELDPLEQSSNYLEDMEEFLMASRRRLARARNLRNIAIGLLVALMVVIIIAFFWANGQRVVAERAAEEARRQTELAQQEKARAEAQRQLAELEKNRADQQAEKARLAQLEAERNLIDANNAKARAEKERQIAESQRRLAELQKQEAETQRALAQANAKIATEQTQLAIEKAVEAEAQTVNANVRRANALILQSLFLAQLAEQESNKKADLPIGRLLAQEALPAQINDSTQRPYVAEAEAALYYTLNRQVNAQPTQTMVGHRNRMIYQRFSPDSRTLISTSWDKTARVWDVASGTVLHTLRGHENVVAKAAFSDDGKRSITTADDFSARVWDVLNDKEIARLAGHTEAITHADISRNGLMAATASSDNTARLWDVENETEVALLRGHSDDVLHTEFSPNGQVLVTTSLDGTARLWNGTDGKEIATLTGHGAPVRFATFNKNSTLLCTVSEDRTARIWRASDGTLLYVLRGHGGAVNHAAFSNDGTRILTASDDKTFIVWDLGNGRMVGRSSEIFPYAHTQRVYHVQWSAGDKHIMTASDDRTIKLWSGHTYLRMAEWSGHPGGGYYGAFSPDGQYLALAGKDASGLPNNILIYKLLPTRQDLLSYGQRTKPRDLTEAEKRQFFITDDRLLKEATEQQLEELRKRLKLESQGSAAPKASSSGSTTPVNTPIRGQESAQPPAPTSRPAPVKQPESAQVLHHSVKRGETLWSIARNHATSVEKLRTLNELRSDALIEGQILVVER